MVLLCHMLVNAAYISSTTTQSLTHQRHMRMLDSDDHHAAVVLPGPAEDLMLPGEYRWIRLVDDRHALTTQAARSAPFNGLLAQTTNGAGSTVVPLLQLQTSRREDQAGAFIEVQCVGRGVIKSAGSGGVAWASVTVHADETSQEHSCDDAMQDLRQQHAACLDASARLEHALGDVAQDGAAWAGIPGDSDTASGVTTFLRTPVDQLISERRNALRRRALGANVKSDAELLSYAACSCLEPLDRLRAIESSSTRDRLLLCVQGIRERHGGITARIALEKALRSSCE